ncbi:MAG TPA: DUF3592 domain-containing protein [Steroidobacteraceae bacterium]|jgi:hypothetical protein|nr:DUF3592 domain-containing protein [Steroidobacteraceae bacterium]
MPAFDWLQSLAAFNQLGVLAAALICGAVGAALLGNALFWRIHAIRVQGEAIGVRRNGTTFRSVYRYALPGKSNVEGTSNEGSSSLEGRESGTRRMLLVIAAHPDEVQEASSHVWSAIGVLFVGAAAWLFRIAVTAWPVNRWTWIAAGLLLLYGGVRIWRSIRPAEKRLGAANFKALIARRPVDDIGAGPLLRCEDIRATPEWRALEDRQRAQRRRFTPVLLITGIALIGIGIYVGRTLVRLESGVRVPGKIIALDPRNSGSHAVYYPLVSFSTGTGTIVHFSDRVGSNPPAYHVGDAVTVIYPAGDLHAAIIDRGWINWLPAGLAFIFGLALFAAGMRALRMRTKTN